MFRDPEPGEVPTPLWSRGGLGSVHMVKLSASDGWGDGLMGLQRLQIG